MIKVYKTVEEIRAIAESWRALCLKSTTNWIYALPEWHIAWWTTIGQGRKMEIIGVYRDNALIGLLPLCILRSSWKEGKVRVLEFSGGTQCDQHDVIAEPGALSEVLDAIEPYLKKLCTRVDVVRLHNIPSDSSTVDWFKKRYQTYCDTSPNPVLRLEGDYAKLEGQWRSSHRGDVRRQRKRLEKEGPLAMEVIREQEKASDMLKEFFEVYRRKWELDGDARVLNNPLMQGPIQRFYQALINTVGVNSGVHFTILTLSGRPISYHFGFLHNDRLYWYRPTYDKNYENFSPSKVHVSMLIELGCKKGWKEFDFLLGAEPYKYAWTTEERHVTSLVFRGRWAGPGWLAAWWIGQGQAVAGRYASSGFIRRLRGIKQA